MEQLMKEIFLTAIIDGTIESNLKAMGYSSRICVGLRKEMGLVSIINNGKKTAVILPHIVNKNQQFCINIKENISRQISPYNLSLNIVYEDDDLAVIDKPSGLAVISTHNHYGKSLENALANIWGSNFVYRPVNRLDRDTSGLMIVAKNKLAHSLLTKSKINRQYLAIVDGIITQNGIIDAPLETKNSQSMIRVVSPTGKSATTIYEVIKTYPDKNYSLIKCTLLTGRTHQIRAHMHHIGHSLCCDKLYNLSPKEIICPNGEKLNRQALHSYTIEFTHPMTKQIIKLASVPIFCNKYDII